MKEIIDQWDLVKIKNVCSVQNTVKTMNRQVTDWEQDLPKTYLIKDSFKIYKGLLKINKRK